jgi:DUF971 family protein
MSTLFRGDAIRPTDIHADRPARRLTIEWADGHRSSYDLTSLRWLCPCAFCRGEAGQPGWLDSDPTLSEEQLTLSDVALVGHYAIQPYWADGHSSGFYSFEHLRRNCPCAEDTARRLAEAAAGDDVPHDHGGAGHHDHADAGHDHGDAGHDHG